MRVSGGVVARLLEIGELRPAVVRGCVVPQARVPRVGELAAIEQATRQPLRATGDEQQGALGHRIDDPDRARAEDVARVRRHVAAAWQRQLEVVEGDRAGLGVEQRVALEGLPRIPLVPGDDPAALAVGVRQHDRNRGRLDPVELDVGPVRVRRIGLPVRRTRSHGGRAEPTSPPDGAQLTGLSREKRREEKRREEKPHETCSARDARMGLLFRWSAHSVRARSVLVNGR